MLNHRWRISCVVVLTVTIAACTSGSTSPSALLVPPSTFAVPAPSAAIGTPSHSATDAAATSTPTANDGGTQTPVRTVAVSASPPNTPWLRLAEGTLSPLWSADSNYMLLYHAGADPPILLYTADGRHMGTYDSNILPAWLGDDTFVAYTDAPWHSTSPHDIPAIIVTASNGTSRQATFPCCDAVGNGGGAAVVYWDPGHPGQPCQEFSVWSNGTLTAPKPGFPDYYDSAWSPTGDKLVIVRPNDDCSAPDIGSVSDVVTWPGLSTIFSGDNGAFSGGKFDPSGAYLAGSTAFQPAQPAHVNDIDIASLATGAIAKVPIQGNQFSFTWNDASELIVSDIAAGTIATHATDGSVVDARTSQPSTQVVGSQDGSTILFNRFDQATFDGEQLTVERDGVTTVLAYPPGNTYYFNPWLSPNGEWLLATTDRGAWLTRVP